MFDQKEFNEFVLNNEIIGFYESPIKISSGRYTNWYVNWRNVAQDVFLLDKLSDYLIEFTKYSGLNPDCFYGVPEGATKLALLTQVKWSKQTPGYGKGSHVLAMGRGKDKDHGDAKDWHFIGQPRGNVVIVEDVSTTGNSLLEAINNLREAQVNIIGAISLTNRMEVRDDGLGVKEAIESKGIPYYSISNSLELLPIAYKMARPGREIGKAIEVEFENYGVDKVNLTNMNFNELISRNKTIIPACKVPLNVYEELVKATYNLEVIGGYMIGFQLALEEGLGKVVEVTRKYTNKPIIYDHQKAGTDIPDTGSSFAKICFEAGVDAVVLFPMAGPDTENVWIDAAKDKGLGIIVGGRMTHKNYVRSEGGYISDDAIGAMYLSAARKGVLNFVVPGNNVDMVKKVKDGLESYGFKPVFYVPGFIAQGGNISNVSMVAGEKWHAIVGRAIYWNNTENRYNTAEEMRRIVEILGRQL